MKKQSVPFFVSGSDIALPAIALADATPSVLLVALVALLCSSAIASAKIRVATGYLAEETTTTAFAFTNVPSVSKNDAAATAKITVLAGTVDSNGGGDDKLNDGQLPTEADQPDENFFFEAGTDGGRLLVDLGRLVEVKQINTYSRHPDTRGPQVYKLYASDGTAKDFNSQPAKNDNLEHSGWKLIASVDTRHGSGVKGGQYGVSISDSDGIIGKYRFLIFDMSRTESDDDFGNTFYSEIDVIENRAKESTSVAAPPFIIKTPDGSCEISMDSTEAPDLKEWAENKLAPVLAEWYPKIAAMLPGEGFAAPKQLSVKLRPGNDVAFTDGTRITANSTWLKRELTGEAIGAIIHEEVHVIQQYGERHRDKPDAKHPPGWLVEGIPDYIRWFRYEPQSHGADLIWLQGRRNLTINYDGRYRITANFLNYVVENYGRNKNLIGELNAACRDDKYTDGLWTELTGKPLAELNDEWKASVQKDLAAMSTEKPNALSETEKSSGWKLLFNGVDFTGWHNFKSDGVRPGWQIKDGALVCADPHNAGDIVTSEKFGAFELELDYNISEGGNSGIIFHVTDDGGAVWATGPEFQLEDNAKASDPQRCGWLYALYQPDDDPKTGKPLDATKPAGQWNHVRLVVSPHQCEHWINGVKYFDYVLNSDDFKDRVAASKFSKMPLFAKAESGYIALQGDHGQISFRNIKVRPLSKATEEARAATQ
jgi:hypothetical protein